MRRQQTTHCSIDSVRSIMANSAPLHIRASCGGTEKIHRGQNASSRDLYSETMPDLWFLAGFKQYIVEV